MLYLNQCFKLPPPIAKTRFGLTQHFSAKSHPAFNARTIRIKSLAAVNGSFFGRANTDQTLVCSELCDCSCEPAANGNATTGLAPSHQMCPALPSSVLHCLAFSRTFARARHHFSRAFHFALKIKINFLHFQAAYWMVQLNRYFKCCICQSTSLKLGLAWELLAYSRNSLPANLRRA